MWLQEWDLNSQHLAYEASNLTISLSCNMALSARLERATHWLTASCSPYWTTREYGATKWYRTTDAKFFKLPLYQLSYRSMVLPIRIEQIFIVYKTIVLTIILKEQFHKTLIYLQIIFKTNLDDICCLCLFMLSRLSILYLPNKHTDYTFAAWAYITNKLWCGWNESNIRLVFPKHGFYH